MTGTLEAPAPAPEGAPGPGVLRRVGDAVVAWASRTADRLVLVGVAAASLAAHVAVVLAGIGIGKGSVSRASLSTLWQLLPVGLLRHQLLSSLEHLPSQPPLFNLATGVLLQLPSVTQPEAANAVMVVCGVVLAVSTAGLLLELGVPRSVTVPVVAVFVLADPAQYLYADVYFYAMPTAALVTVAAWAAVRWARTERWTCGLTYGVAAALLVLTNSTYQVELVAIAAIPVLVVLRRRWRQALAVLVAPIVVVGAWYANDFARFGTTTTSSWVGMNLARATLALDSPADLRHLVDVHVLSPLALLRPFLPLQYYAPSLADHAATGVPALDWRLKLNPVEPNYNNLSYIKISNEYLSQDLRFIEHRPAQYLRNLTVSLRLWLLPTDQWYATAQLVHYHLDGYTTLYDTVVDLQPTSDLNAAWTVVRHRLGPGWSNLSYTAVAETLLAIVVLPLALWRRRRRVDPRTRAGAWSVWLLTALVFVTTTLLEAAENNRFRFELGGLVLAAATVAAVLAVAPSALGRGRLGGAGGEGDVGTGQLLAVDDEPPGVAAARGEG